AALELMVEAQSLDLKMTDVAKRADVPVGTLYQFFPSRSALIARLFDEQMAPISESVRDLRLDSVDQPALASSIYRQMSEHLRLVQREPALAVIWGSPSVDPAIQAADLENTQSNARLLVAGFSHAYGMSAEDPDLQATALLICHLWSGVIRLCLGSDSATSERLLQQYAAMIASHVTHLAARKD
ncbi:MAG: TetR/AcrR family transcriptional regulator, partial [Pseudomonadota bacterium]